MPIKDNPVSVILVVEDEVLIRMVIADYLRECGYHVYESATVGEAKSVMDADTKVHLVFSDVQMSGKADGFELASWIRTHHPGVKVILTSGWVGAVDKARDLCHDGPVISKPYEHAFVLQRIQELLRKAAGN